MLRSRSHHALEAALRRVWLRTVPRAAPSSVPLAPQHVGAYALVADGVGGRGIHTSSTPPLAGRRDGNAPSPRLKNWKKYLSKRAKKRHRNKLEKWAKHANRGALVKASKAAGGKTEEKKEAFDQEALAKLFGEIDSDIEAGPKTQLQTLAEKFTDEAREEEAGTEGDVRQDLDEGRQDVGQYRAERGRPQLTSVYDGRRWSTMVDDGRR